MKGHIRCRGKRSWELKFDVAANGSRQTRYASFKGTKRDAEVRLAQLISAAATGEHIDPSRMTVGEFLDRWERDHGQNVSPKTLERYRELLRKHRALGHAEQWGLTQRNVAALVDPPRVPSTEIAILRDDQIRAVLDRPRCSAIPPTWGRTWMARWMWSTVLGARVSLE
jgi:hypothetical protein